MRLGREKVITLDTASRKDCVSSPSSAFQVTGLQGRGQETRATVLQGGRDKEGA